MILAPCEDFPKAYAQLYLNLPWLVLARMKQVPRHCCQPVYLELKQDHQTEGVSNGNYFHLLLSWASPEPSFEKSISYGLSRPTYPIQQMFFFFFPPNTGLKISCVSTICVNIQVAILATCYFLDSGLAITVYFVPIHYLWSVLTAAKFEFWSGFNAFALAKTFSTDIDKKLNPGNFPG